MPRPRLTLLGAMMGAALMSLTLAAPTAANPDWLVVVTDKGAVRGTVTDTGRVFYRIPFAAPPVGNLRWRAPHPAEQWAGVRDATVAGPACAQDESPLLNQPRVTTEDCLYLNVYTPRGRSRHRPVMVWFHGGGFTGGSANQYDGSALAGRGVVVVTVNYRLGAFGFLAHPALSGEDPRVKSGNYGLLDQQAALRWVQANASAFGGDTRRVTIFGESAGGISVCDHLTSPLAAGLFTRAIIQSGPCALLARALPGAEAVGVGFATTAGCQDQHDVSACLRARPVDAILDAMRGTPAQGSVPPWAPTSETPVLPRDPTDAIASGAYHRVPVIAGTTLDEGTIFVAFLEAQGTPINAQTYPAVLSQMFGANAPGVQAEYPGAAYGEDYRLALSAVYTDSLFACPSLALNRSLSTRTPTYAYEFADRTAPNLYPLTPDFPLGAFHGSELAYLFRNLAPLNPSQRLLSDHIQSYWTRFAATGNPNQARAPRWRPFRPDYPTVLTMNLTHITNRYGFDTRHHCGFWSTIGLVSTRSGVV
jgi:para-nitrobenzyl esterase